MTITVYKSTDVDAPILTGNPSAFINVLDACLVNGYGSKAPAGWTKEYSGTNLAAYRMSTIYPATGMYLRVNDNAALEARFWGFESMSDIDTGTNRFPTNSQVTNGLYFRKSNTSDATVRPWIVIANERFVYVISTVNSTTFSGARYDDGLLIFGDIISYKPLDKYNCFIYGAATSSSSAHNFSSLNAPGYSSLAGHYLARDYTGLILSKELSKTRYAPHNIYSSGSSNIGLDATAAYPDPVTGKVNLFHIEIVENSNQGIRGRLPGLYDPYGGKSIRSSYDIINGSGELSGEQLILIPIWNSTSDFRAAIQITGSWY